MLEKISGLERVLAAIDGGSSMEKKAAFDLVSKWYKRMRVELSGSEREQYAAVAAAALRGDVQTLREYLQHSQFQVVRDFCREELDPKSSAAGQKYVIGVR